MKPDRVTVRHTVLSVHCVKLQVLDMEWHFVFCPQQAGM